MRASLFLLANAIVSVAASPLGSLGQSLTLGLASWDLEGYAKDNPIGPTTGGKGGKKVYVSTAEELVAAVSDDKPRIVYVKGEISLPARLSVGSNKSILGVGWNAVIRENGITVSSHNNVIIRNLKIVGILEDDCITLTNATRVWIDHNEFAGETNPVVVGPDFYVCCEGSRSSQRCTNTSLGWPG